LGFGGMVSAVNLLWIEAGLYLSTSKFLLKGTENKVQIWVKRLSHFLMSLRRLHPQAQCPGFLAEKPLLG
jgi:hypothetical protein